MLLNFSLDCAEQFGFFHIGVLLSRCNKKGVPALAHPICPIPIVLRLRSEDEARGQFPNRGMKFRLRILARLSEPDLHYYLSPIESNLVGL